ncbi:MAG: ABC transporter substrate-binding protein [Chloroflexi bacterium]|nr:ABC transporter substrate-binding protein [Chloroflexota bacterium]
MAKRFIKPGILIMALLLMTLPLLVACGDGGNDKPVPTSTATAPTKELTITIGNHTDITGASANAVAVINMGLQDLADYFTKEILPGGVKIKVLPYDNQHEPAKAVPGYRWLKDKGADLIFACIPDTPPVLKPSVNADKTVLFSSSTLPDIIDPPGYIFNLGTIPQYEGLTLVKWIAENDWDYKTKGPAKIGGAGWNDGYHEYLFDGVEAYAKAHPDQFTWVGEYLTDFGFTWGQEVEALKNCDYVIPCAVMASFVREYRLAGGKGKFIGAGTHSAFLGMMHDAGLWDEMDGMLFLLACKWWGEEGVLIDLAERLLEENHADKAESIRKQGSGYAAISNFYAMFDIIAKTVESVGPENFNSQTLYETAQTYSLTIEDGVMYSSYSQTKRDALDAYRIYRVDGTLKDLIVADPDWVPVVRNP